MKYDPGEIERKWQKLWFEHGVYEPGLESAKKPVRQALGKPFYNLMMFPYPSGDGLHVGNMYAFTGSDIYGRFKRMHGYDVFEPIGLDGFGIHSENYAIKTGTHPARQAQVTEKRFYEQLRMIGNGFAWKERLETYDPEYYRWTQWIFVQMFKHGLAYRKTQSVNWCPSCKTVLADEQVIAGKCERCGTEVVKKDLEQWFFKITEYAERLLKNLETIDWSDNVKVAQRNWIGKSEGAEIDFPVVFKKGTNFLILHGYTGSPGKNFIPWLKQKLEDREYKVQAPAMPNSNDPKENEQVNYVLENCKIDENTIVIGHSLGGVVAMKLLARHNQPIQGLILVAPAIDPSYPGATEKPFWKYFKWNYDYDQIKKLAPVRTILSDLQEKKRIAHLEFLRDKLDAKLITGVAKREHFCATEEPIILENVLPKIQVFTTRPDTLFGATYMVLAPEHQLVSSIKYQVSNWPEVQKYIEQAKRKTELTRKEEAGDKTGVELKGVKAINPATKEEIPIWVADYVLMGYGTGAIMAVPAHDERDFEFAKKFKLPIRQVIAPHFEDEKSKRQDGYPTVTRRTVYVILRNPKTDEYLTLDWGEFGWRTFIVGGVDENEDLITAAKREIMEETGYKNLRFVKNLHKSCGSYFAAHKKENRLADADGLLFELIDEEQGPISKEEEKKHTMRWTKAKEVDNCITISSQKYAWEQCKKESPHVEEGVLVNSGRFDGEDSEKAKWEITKFVGGQRRVQYKLRDWLISRQRYWGPPIPMVYCENCAKGGLGERKDMPGWYAVPEKDLPVRLPFVEDFRPRGKGKSPLASVKSFYETKCPNCGGKARRETDVSDTFLDSAWYYLRYPSINARNSKLEIRNSKLSAKGGSASGGEIPWNQEITRRWLPVDMYIGGAEHSVLHLLYSRFLAMAFYDWNLVHFEEPFAKFRAHGLLIREGAKMSKSKGNVVNPDEYIGRFGADTLRMYLMFLAPFEQGGDFRDQAVLGVARFLERAWKMGETLAREKKNDFGLELAVHEAIKKVTNDIENLHYNTAISSLMILLNAMESAQSVSEAHFEIFLKLLAPFAPHITEEMWSRLSAGKSRIRDLRSKSGHQSAFRSIHRETWPVLDTEKLRRKTFMLVVQINGKVRDSFEVPVGVGEEEAAGLALNREKVKNILGGGKPKKTVYVPQKLINFVL